MMRLISLFITDSWPHSSCTLFPFNIVSSGQKFSLKSVPWTRIMTGNSNGSRGDLVAVKHSFLLASLACLPPSHLLLHHWSKRPINLSRSGFPSSSLKLFFCSFTSGRIRVTANSCNRSLPGAAAKGRKHSLNNSNICASYKVAGQNRGDATTEKFESRS